MEYEYRIDSADCKNYIMAYNESIRIYEKMKVFGAILLGIFGLFQVLKSIKQDDYKIVIINIIINIIMVIFWCIFIKSDYFYHESTLKNGESYLKKHPKLHNEQKVKLEDDGVLYHINNTTKKIVFNDIKKVILENTTIVVFGNVNVLLFMIPTHVFANEDEKEKFIEILNNNIRL